MKKIFIITFLFTLLLTTNGFALSTIDTISADNQIVSYKNYPVAILEKSQYLINVRAIQVRYNILMNDKTVYVQNNKKNYEYKHSSNNQIYQQVINKFKNDSRSFIRIYNDYTTFTGQFLKYDYTIKGCKSHPEWNNEHYIKWNTLFKNYELSQYGRYYNFYN